MLPPLLFAATQRAKAREFRENAGAVSFLAVGLRAVLRRASDVERTLVLDARRGGRVSPASADEVQRDIEGRVPREDR